MKLSRVERVILANQLRILEQLIPDEAKYLEHSRTALEQGYEGEYEEIVQNVYPSGLTEEECTEVIMTLAMFDWLKHSYERLPDKSGIDEYALTFHGYDGNNETSFMTYLEYIFDEDRFTDLLAKKEFNSHGYARETYQRMLDRFNEITEGRRSELLTKDELASVLEARIHPENRAKKSH